MHGEASRCPGLARYAYEHVPIRPHVHRTRSVAERAGGVAAEAKQQVGGAGQTLKVGQPADVEGQPSGVTYDGGPASAKDAGSPSQPVEPPFTTRARVGER